MNIMRIGSGLAATAAVIALGACGSAKAIGSGPAGGPQQAVTSTQPTPASSPNGTFKGACDYTLGNDPVNGTAVATGDIEITSTGNTAITVTATLTWPQQGYNPLSQTKTGVQVPAGQTVDVQFNQPLTSGELDNLQNWQTGHMGDTGCTYDVAITGSA